MQLYEFNGINKMGKSLSKTVMEEETKYGFKLGCIQWNIEAGWMINGQQKIQSIGIFSSIKR